MPSWWNCWDRWYGMKGSKKTDEGNFQACQSKKMDSSERARPSKYAGHAQRASEAASEFPSLLTVRNATANASSIHFQKRIEGPRDSLRGRAALLEVEDIYKPAASKRGLKQTSGDGSASIASRCSLPATCMHANTQFVRNNQCTGSPAAKADRDPEAR